MFEKAKRLREKGKITQSFEYKILVKWVLFTEVLYLLLVLIFMLCDEFGGNGFLKYMGLQKEGIQTVTIIDYSARKEDLISRKYADDIEITTYHMKCSTVLDEKEFIFTADAVDVIGRNSEKMSREYAGNKEAVTGYLFSSHNREKLYFSHNIDDGIELFWYKAQKRFLFRYYGKYIYKMIIYLITGVCFIENLKIKNKQSIFDILISRLAQKYYEYKIGIPKHKNKFLVAKDNYTNKAIKLNPEYKLYENEEFENKYSLEFVAVAENIKCGEYRISAKQVEAISEVFKRDESKKTLKGPIFSKYVLGHEAVLLSRGHKLPFTGKYWISLVERTVEGNYAKRRVKVDYAYVHNIPGNQVLVIRGDEEIGVYENVLKNRNNQLLSNYESLMKEMKLIKLGCYMQWVILFIVSAILVIMVWIYTKELLIFPRIAFSIIAARTYKYMNQWLRKRYISRYGLIIYENMNGEFWRVLFYLLTIFALIIAWFR